MQAASHFDRFLPADFKAAFASQPREYEYWITEIEGEVPTALRGTLFRNGPGRLLIFRH